ncbi:c-type cytochrome [Microvirga terrestris]|uniref:C-type cytochrome n=1 Tax=Microvirga terrestris TaxID=2791024 RepID=A0ABS0HTY0_9HYPH|nr:c-type cytochrome [Microvirga terrestris]MBF9196941.1 c-type cytochrome [Microvirga terrestris]
MIRTLGILLLLMVPAFPKAQEAGDPSAGLRLAREVCAACHAVESGQNRSPRAQAPTFTDIALVPGMTTTALTVALRTSHKTMPNIMLEPRELRDVTAYITSLQRQP